MVIHYKQWVINQRIKELKKWIKYAPDSDQTEKRKQEISDLELELKGLE